MNLTGLTLVPDPVMPYFSTLLQFPAHAGHQISPAACLTCCLLANQPAQYIRPQLPLCQIIYVAFAQQHFSVFCILDYRITDVSWMTPVYLLPTCVWQAVCLFFLAKFVCLNCLICSLITTCQDLHLHFLGSSFLSPVIQKYKNKNWNGAKSNISWTHLSEQLSVCSLELYVCLMMLHARWRSTGQLWDSRRHLVSLWSWHS